MTNGALILTEKFNFKTKHLKDFKKRWIPYQIFESVDLEGFKYDELELESKYREYLFEQLNRFSPAHFIEASIFMKIYHTDILSYKVLNLFP